MKHRRPPNYNSSLNLIASVRPQTHHPRRHKRGDRPKEGAHRVATSVITKARKHSPMSVCALTRVRLAGCFAQKRCHVPAIDRESDRRAGRERIASVR